MRTLNRRRFQSGQSNDDFSDCPALSLSSAKKLGGKLMQTSIREHWTIFMRTTLITLLLILAGSIARAQTIADSVANFSGTQGSNGWYYGYYDVTGDVVPGYNPTNDFRQFTIWDGTAWHETNGI